MLGTAFRVNPLASDAVGAGAGKGLLSETGTTCATQPLFLTAKHTFAPWDFTKDSNDLKIPHEFRKARFVIGKMYAYDETTGDATATACEEMSLVSMHPTLDVALLSLRRWPPASPAAELFASAPALPLLPVKHALQKGSAAVIEGFRGAGQLGELDTFDPSLLKKLPPEAQEALMKQLQDVEGRQTRAITDVAILDPLGMCHGVGDAHPTCYHGMSGGPVTVSPVEAAGENQPPYCAGVLYGKHPDYPQNIGYTPVCALSSWLQDTVTRFQKAAVTSATSERPA